MNLSSNGSDVFHYPYGPMWTAVIGEHDRVKEEGYEKRVMVDQIFIHERFNEYHNDIGKFRFIVETIKI